MGLCKSLLDFSLLCLRLPSLAVDLAVVSESDWSVLVVVSFLLEKLLSASSSENIELERSLDGEGKEKKSSCVSRALSGSESDVSLGIGSSSPVKGLMRYCLGLPDDVYSGSGVSSSTFDDSTLLVSEGFEAGDGAVDGVVT